MVATTFEQVLYSVTGGSTTVQRNTADRLGDIVNVKELGAVGDGVAIDTTAIQAAFNYNILLTSAITASGAILHFTSVPSWIVPGMQAQDTSGAGTQIAQGLYVKSTTTTTVTLSSNVSAQVNIGDGICFGLTGRVYFPPGRYLIDQPILMGPALGVGHGQTVVHMEGAGATQSTILTTGFNGFAFDNMSPTSPGFISNPWTIKNLQIQNSYIPSLIYNNSVTTSGAWAIGAASIVVTAATAPNIARGAILFSHPISGSFGISGAGAVPGYIGYVTAVALNTPSAGLTTLTLGDKLLNGVTGAQIPSSNGGTGTSDKITYVQGYFAAASFTANSSTSITMASDAANPGLDAGNYYIWNWTKITGQGAAGGAAVNGASPFPTCCGVTSSANWTGTSPPTIAILNGLGSYMPTTSVGADDLLVLTPISGAIRLIGCQGSTVENCRLGGIIGFETQCVGIPTAAGNSTGVITQVTTIKDCSMVAPATSAMIGCHGIVLAQACLAQNTDVSGNWVGCRMVGINPTFYGGRFEVCAYGIALGGFTTSPAFVGNRSCSNPVIAQSEGEGCWIAGVAADTSNAAGLYCYNLSANSSHGNNCYGFYLGNAGMSACAFIACQASSAGAGPVGMNHGGYWNPSFKGPGTSSGFYIPASSVRTSFISCLGIASPGTNNITTTYQGNHQEGGVAWKLPTTQSVGLRFLNSNNPPVGLTFASLPAPATGLTGTIGDGAGGSGNLLQFSAGSFGGQTFSVGSGVTGTGVTRNTFVTSTTPNATYTQVLTVNNAHNFSGTLALQPVADGEEYIITDSPIPASPTLAAGGSWTTTSTAITMGATIPGIVVGGQTVFDDTTNQYIGTVDPASSGTNLLLTATATHPSTGAADVLVFNPVSNYGAAVVVGGGTYTIKVRWSSSRANWLLA